MSWDDGFYEEQLRNMSRQERDALYYGKWEAPQPNISHILELISTDPFVQHEAYRNLLKKWPQLNRATRIARTQYRTVFITDPLPPLNVMDNMIRVIVSGWQKLRGTAMTPTLKRLDDPQERWKYSKRLWWATIKSPMYVFWRIMGRVFKREHWYQRGTELVPDPVIKMPKLLRREIRLEEFGWRFVRGWRVDEGRFICGYDAETDTLWVRD